MMETNSVIFFVFDDLNRFVDCFSSTLNDYNYLNCSDQGDSEVFKNQIKWNVVLTVNGYFLSHFKQVFLKSEFYRAAVTKKCIQSFKAIPHSGCFVKFLLVKPNAEILDFAWNQKIKCLVSEKRDLENAMSWLSTLGGAFSALGDSLENCAKVAGKISVHQFKIAFHLGDPLLVARCRLYMALSLMQLGKLSVAKKMILQQYEISKVYKDIRLQNMCKGTWAKLQYMSWIQKNKNLKKRMVLSM